MTRNKTKRTISKQIKKKVIDVESEEESVEQSEEQSVEQSEEQSEEESEEESSESESDDKHEDQLLKHDDIMNISFEDINDKFCYGNYCGIKVVIMKENGYINVTKICNDSMKEIGSK